MEKSHFEGVCFMYLTIKKNGITVAIVPCYTYQIDIANITTGKLIRNAIRRARFVYKDFFKIRAFVIGTYIACCEHLLEWDTRLQNDELEALKEVVNSEIKAKYVETMSKFIFVKDVRESAINSTRSFLSDFRFFVSFPTTVIPVLDNFKYPTALNKKNRKRYRLFTSKFNERFEWEVVNDFKNISNIIFRLYSNVFEKASNKFEILNSAFFSNVNHFLKDKSQILIAKDRKNGEIRVVELLLRDENRLYPLYLGVDYKDDDAAKILYLNTIFKTVEIAEETGSKIIELGQTSYYPKVMSGAFVENIYYGFWSDKTLYKYFIKHLFGKICTPPQIHHHVYSDVAQSHAYRLLKDNNINPLN
ncbi:hypothetical protein Pgin02_01203 [Porphyromonas gingivalis]